MMHQPTPSWFPARRPAYGSTALGRRAGLMAAQLLVGSGAAFAVPPDSTKVAEMSRGSYDGFLLGDLFGARKALDDLGLSATAFATLDLSASSGGVERVQTGQYLVDLSIEWDLGKPELVEGGLAFFNFLYWNSFGDSPDAVGSAWGWNVIDPGLGGEVLQIAEVWWQQRLGDSGLTLRAGKIDANRFFALPYEGTAFVNAAAYMPSTMLSTTPTYPNSAIGVMLEWDLDDWFIQAAIFDGSTAAFNPNLGENGPRTGNRGFQGTFNGHSGPFLITEGGPSWQIGAGEGGTGWAGSLRLGGWMQVGESQLSTDAGTTVVRNPGGLYLTLKQDLHGPLDEGSRCSLFAQAGWSDPAKVDAEWSLMGGLVWSAPFSGRPEDSAGLLLGYTAFSGDPLVANSPVTNAAGGSEALVELFYRFELGTGVSVQPDLQWICTPGGGDPSGVSDAWIATLRMQIAF